MIKLVILDVDGTITDQDRNISTSAIEAIRAVQKKGITVSLISGNVIPVMYALRIYLGINGPVFAENGGVEYDKGITPFFTMDKPMRLFNRLREMDLCEGILTNEWRYCSVAFFPNPGKEDEIYDIARDYKVTLTDSGFSWHILNTEQSKGFAIKKLSEDFGIKLEDVLACGDSLNDMSMFQMPVRKAVPKSAREELKALADYTSNESYGESIRDILSRIDSF